MFRLHVKAAGLRDAIICSLTLKGFVTRQATRGDLQVCARPEIAMIAIYVSLELNVAYRLRWKIA